MTRKRRREIDKEDPLELEKMIKDLKALKDDIILKYSVSYSRSRIVDSIQGTIYLITERKIRMTGETNESKENKLTISQKITKIEEDIKQIQTVPRQIEVDNYLKQEEPMACSFAMIGMETAQPAGSFVFLSLCESCNLNLTP